MVTEHIRERARDKGFEELLDHFVEQVRAHPHFGSRLTAHPEEKAINLKDSGGTPITVHWRYRSGKDGLYVGIRGDVEARAGRYLHELLPNADKWQKRWKFGFFQSCKEIDDFFRSA